MALRDFLTPEEQVKYICKRDIKYENKKYDLFITNKRIILYKERGLFNKTEEVLADSLDKIKGIDFKEKGGLLNLGRISLKGDFNVDIKGPIEETKVMYTILRSLLSISSTLNKLEEVAEAMQDTNNKNENENNQSPIENQNKITTSNEETKLEDLLTSKLSKLTPEDHLFIKTLELRMNNHYHVWAKVYPNIPIEISKTDKAKMEVELNGIYKSMCADYIKLMNFLTEVGISVAPSYRHLKYLCAEFKPDQN